MITSGTTKFKNEYVANGEPKWLAENPDYALQLLETGIHNQPTQFVKACYVHPDEVVPLMESCGLGTLSLGGCEGVVAGHEDKVNQRRQVRYGESNGCCRELPQ